MTYALSHARLLEVLTYEPSTGVWRWRVDVKCKGGGKKAGALAGATEGDPYVRIGLDGKLYRAHRLAFFYMTGKWPVRVDHANGRSKDTAWGNLREATASQNGANSKRRKDNTSGLKGVHFNRQARKWQAEIVVNQRKTIILKTECRAVAYLSYVVASHQAFGEFSRAA